MISKVGESSKNKKRDQFLQEQLKKAYDTANAQPAGAKTSAELHRSWQEKCVSQAVRKYTACKHYNELLIENNYFGVGKAIAESSLQEDSCVASPLGKIYGEGYLNRKGVIRSSVQKRNPQVSPKPHHVRRKLISLRILFLILFFCLKVQSAGV